MSGTKAKQELGTTTMNNLSESFSSRLTAMALTLLFSAAMVAGAVGPALNGNAANVAALDNAQGEQSQSLA